MKLTREQLNCSTDKQLAFLGFKRQNNPGWMQRAMERDFSEQDIAQYHALRPAKVVAQKPWTLELRTADGAKFSITTYSREGMILEMKALLARI